MLMLKSVVVGLCSNFVQNNDQKKTLLKTVFHNFRTFA
jgi:hypothetical protein